MPFVAPIVLTMAFVVSAYTIHINAQSLRTSQFAATPATDLGALSSPTASPGTEVRKNYDTTAADKQCPKETETSKYRHDKPWNKQFKDTNGKTIQNLYGKPCKSDFVEAFCSSVNVCNGGLAGSKCYGSSGWEKCGATHPSVRALQTTQSAGMGTMPNVQGSSQPVTDLSKLEKPAPPEQSSTPVSGNQQIGSAYKPAQTNSPTSPSVSTQPTPAQQIGSLTGAQTASNPASDLGSLQKPTFNAALTNVANLQPVSPTGTSLPTAAPAQSSPSSQTTFPRNTYSTGLPSPTNPTTQQPNTPSQPSHTNPSNDSPNTRPSTATPRGQTVQNFFGGIASFFSGIVSGGGGGGQTTVVQNRVQYVPRPVVHPTTIVVQQSQPTNSLVPQPTQAVTPARNSETTAALRVRVPETPRVYIASTLDDGEIIQVEVSRPTTTLGQAPLELPRLIDTSPSEFTSSAAERTERTTPTETPTLFMQGMGSSTENIRRAFVEKVAPSSASIKMADGFRAASTSPRASALVQVFHAISISDLLDAITHGSLDVIKRVLGRGEPETPLKVVQYEERPIAPARQGQPAALQLNEDSPPTAGEEVPARVQDVDSDEKAPRDAAVQRDFSERLRENPVSIFQETAIVYQVHGHVPLIQSPRVFPDIVPVPQASLWSAEERPKVFVALDNAFNGVKRWFRNTFPWLNKTTSA